MKPTKKTKDKLSSDSRQVNGHIESAPSLANESHLFNGRFQTGIGVYDGLSALLAEKWKFDFVWISSFCCSATMGYPDVGIIAPEDILAVVRCVHRLIRSPIVIDLDSGYGDPVKIFHVISEMARAGASALCIEDNPLAKRCSLYDGYDRALVSIEEHVARLRSARAALDQIGSTCRLIARTEALVAGMGGEEALKRAHAYVDGGAHAIFIQSLDATGGEVLKFGKEWKRRTPLFIAPTRMPQITKGEFAKAGISHKIFANQGLRAAHAAVDRAFGMLAKGESAQTLGSQISSVLEIATLVGAEKVVELEAMLAQTGGKPPTALLRNTGSGPTSKRR